MMMMMMLKYLAIYVTDIIKFVKGIVTTVISDLKKARQFCMLQNVGYL